MVESMATPTPASTMESMASVRLRLSLRLMLRLILPSSTLFLLSAPMDTLLFPLLVVWLEPLVWLEQLVWLAPLVLSAPMGTPLSPLLSRLWSLVSMAMAFTESESMASVMLRLIPTSITESMVELVTTVESMATPTLASTMESMASVRLRRGESMDSPTLLDSAMPTPPTSDMESTMAKQIIWGFPEFDHLTKHCGYHKQ